MSGNEPTLPRRVPAPSALDRLRAYTDARVGLGQAGAGLPTTAVLRLTLDHARARDAVSSALDVEGLACSLQDGDWPLRAVSAAPTRQVYLTRPDLGRQVSEAALTEMARRGLSCTLAVTVADGLSALAVNLNAAPLIAALRQRLPAGTTLGTVLLEHGRVAAGDRIAMALGARAALVLIGERPGLSAADSLGAYLTWNPRIDTRDSERYCVSNIRKGGLSIEAAADQIAALLERSRLAGRSGVAIAPPADGAAG